MTNVYVCGAAAIATVKQMFYLIAERKPAILIGLVSERYHSLLRSYCLRTMADFNFC